MGDESANKFERVLGIYTRLMSGALINKEQEAVRYGVNERSIQRDIDDIRNFLEEGAGDDTYTNSIVYDRREKAFRLEQMYKLKLTNPEVLAICKILLDSRAFTADEMHSMLTRVVESCVPKSDQKRIRKMIGNEEFHYIQPRHGSVFIDRMWDIACAIEQNRYIEISYQGIQGSSAKTRKLKPVAIMFSEMYFYMCAFIDDKKVREHFNVLEDAFPTIYRVDRILELKLTDEHYHIPYRDRFEEGEFRKRVQFMYGGRLRTVRFKYRGYAVESVLDRLPTARILGEEPMEDDPARTVYTISAEVFGDGIDMWLRSQGENVERLDTP